jgi:hypothetical protein
MVVHAAESTRSWRVVVLGLAGAVNIVIALVLRFRLAGHPSGSASRASRRAASAPAARKATPVGWEWAPVAANLSVGTTPPGSKHWHVRALI